MKKTIILWIFLAKIIVDTCAVNGLESTTPMLMSPNAAALAMYADYPVSHYTGVPEISIPLYEIEVDGFKLPISLSYHANGIKVAQEASWVGLGWTLNAGGAISRTIKCEDDFTKQLGGNISHTIIGKGWYYDTEPLLITGGTYPILANKYFNNILENGPGNIMEAVRKINTDTEPDLFFYNLPHFSGKFIYNKPKKPVLFTGEHNLKIERNETFSINNFHYFKITDAEGVVYLFEEQETARTYPHGEGSTDWYDANTSWLLTKIITRNKQEIIFSYENEYSSTPEYRSRTHSQQIGHFHSGPGSFSTMNIPTRTSCTLTDFTSYRLSKIEWNNGYIEFTPSIREDLRISYQDNALRPKKLDKMNIYTKDGTLLKSLIFQYDYFNNAYAGNNTYLYKRLKLKNVTETDANGNALNSGYNFDYFAGDLPAKNSNNKDYWGYNNGADYGEAYYTACVFYDRINIITNPESNQPYAMFQNNTTYPGAVKKSNFDFLKIGTLKAMALPTGDTTVFEYEENSFYNPEFARTISNNIAEVYSNWTGGGLRIAKIRNGSKTRMFEYEGGKLLVQPVLLYVAYEMIYHQGYALDLGIFKKLDVLGIFDSPETLEIYTHLVRLSESTIPLATFSKGNFVGYNKVREIASDGNQKATTEYRFHNEEECPMDEENPYLPTEPNFWNGMVESITSSKNDGSWVQTIEYEYDETPTANITCYSFNGDGNDKGNFYDYFVKDIFKKSETVKYYLPPIDDATTSIFKGYTYNNRSLPKADSIYNYDSWHTTKYKYPFDFNDAVSAGMTAQNIIGNPIEIVQLKDNKVVGGQKMQYAENAGRYLPSVQYRLHTASPLVPTGYENAYQPEVYFDLYNAKGKLLQLHTPALTTVYLWGYNNSYPIAEIKNATYEQVKTVLSEALINRVADAFVPAAADLAAVNNLRTALPAAMVSTYTYQPLVGMVSATDARGIKTSYTYDEFQRLKNIADLQGNLLQEYKYHYQSR